MSKLEKRLRENSLFLYKLLHILFVIVEEKKLLVKSQFFKNFSLNLTWKNFCTSSDQNMRFNSNAMFFQRI